MFLSFILLSWINQCYAKPDQPSDISYNTLIRKIHTHEIGIYRNEYNPSKTAAIVFPELGPPVYINFKTKKTYKIAYHYSKTILSVSILLIAKSKTHA